MKAISYSLFRPLNDVLENFEFSCYVRIFYFNILMNKLLYPEWVTHLNIDVLTYKRYMKLVDELVERHSIIFDVWPVDNLCKSMLWRMSPLFNGYEAVLCRDADALTSYREAQIVYEWEKSELAVHSIHDNTAHNVPIMGGMCGFRGEALQKKYGTFQKMIDQSPVTIKERGSDQSFLYEVIYKDFKYEMMLHNFKGTQDLCGQYRSMVTEIDLPEVPKRYWTSDLCSFFIGSAGVNEMETLRFFRSFVPEFWKDTDLWASYPKIF